MFRMLLIKALAEQGRQATVDSAGTAAAGGEPASAGAIAALRQRGLDLTRHRSRSLASLNLADYDHIYVVSSRHAAHMRSQGVPPERISVLAAAQGGVVDPWGGDQAAYEDCAAALDEEAQRIAVSLGK